MYRLMTETITGSDISNPEKQAEVSAKAHPNWSDISRPILECFFLKPFALESNFSSFSSTHSFSPSITLGVF